MKIKQVIHLITTIERGGAEKQLLILAREQIKIGLKVEIIYLKGKPELKDNFEAAGCTVNGIFANKSLYKQVILLSKLLRNTKIIVHAHLPQAELVAALSTKKNRFIISRHNSERFWPSGPKILSIIFSRVVCIRASSGIAISNAVKEFNLRSREVPKNFQFVVIYYGCDLKPYISQNGIRQISSGFPNSSNIKIIGAIGRLVDQKNYPTLLQAFALSLKEYKDIHLVVVGSGDSKQELINISNRLKINHKITWLGRIEYIPEFLSKIDVFVLPSNYEGFGLVLLEAMVANKPILAANNSSIPEVLGSNHTGLFETRNYEDLSFKINKVLTEAKFEKDLKKNYEKQLSLFDSKKMVKKILKVYEQGFLSNEFKVR